MDVKAPDDFEELQARFAELEARMSRIEQAHEAGSHPISPGHSQGADPHAAAPQAAPTRTAPSEHEATPGSSADDDPFWVLTGLKERYPKEDVILYAGTMSVGTGTTPSGSGTSFTGASAASADDHLVAPGNHTATSEDHATTSVDGAYQWQFGLPTASVLDSNFADAAPVLTALAHPVRLALVQAVLTGTHTTADLAALPGIGTSGQAYHHLNLLASAGWLRSPRRGRWEVPGERTIPLLALIMAATT